MADYNVRIDSLGATLRQSQLLRLLALGLLALLLLIPVNWVRQLIAERSVRQLEAAEEVVSKWGRTQTLAGPALVVPYQKRRIERDRAGTEFEKTELRHLVILPDVLQVHTTVESELRHRGIFVVPVYRLKLDVDGAFSLPDLKTLDVDPSSLDWPRARVVVGLTDARAIQNRAVLTWNGEERAFRPGAGDPAVVSADIHAPLGIPLQDPTRFSFRLHANGSSGVYFTPVGQETAVTIESNWTTPSFQGSWLPAERTVDAKGFTARWSIPFLGRSQPQAWTLAAEEKPQDLMAARFGVELLMPIDAHRMADRSVKYAHLFILLTFATIWLFEVLTKVRVHPIQYLMIGAALCIFYLLELALAEHIGFGRSYAMASFAVVALIASYAAVVLRGWGRALGVAGLVGVLYVYLYVLLTNEDYALLFGAIGLFVALAVTMMLTRRIDWYGVGGE